MGSCFVTSLGGEVQHADLQDEAELGTCIGPNRRRFNTCSSTVSLKKGRWYLVAVQLAAMCKICMDP